jgi:hypothetical protein
MKDNVFTIPLPGSDLVFTRYLFIKQEVRIALLVCILHKSNNALFWAYELYFSGFKYELIYYFWNIYFDLFATINPSYEAYLLKKYKDYLVSDEDNQLIIIGSIINDFLFRSFNLDMFLLKNLYTTFAETKTPTISEWINTNDYRSIAQWIMNNNVTTTIYEQFLDEFEKYFKLAKNRLLSSFENILKISIDPKIVLLSKIMSLFSKKHNLKFGKSIYVSVSLEEIEDYKTIQIKHNTILHEIYSNCPSIDQYHYLGLFKLTRDKYNIKEKYWYNWEYHASFSPLWHDRIKQFGGYINPIKQTVTFQEDPNDDLMQQFYELHGLEPDEQSLYTKSIPTIQKKTNWQMTYNCYNQNNLFIPTKQELEQLDTIC